jgi:DNA polymerase-3 subunit delta'
VVDYLDDIVGQETAKKFIRTAINKDNLYNFLLVGPRGVGKRLFGFALAKTLGCPLNSPNFHLITPIPSKIKEKKERIQEYARKYLPDNALIEVEDRASILIEQMRNLTERLVHMPSVDTKRVVLILEAERMTHPAANYFLKTLEEPPVDTVFILTSSRPEYLLLTIRSRCQIVPFTYLKAKQIAEVVFDGRDDFLLGSAGEVLALRDSGVIDNGLEIFKKAPLSVRSAALCANTYERRRIVDLYYPLLLLYRLVFYKKLNMVGHTVYDFEIARKAKRITMNRTIDTIMLLNHNINLLEKNPNRVLHLFNVLLRLP